MRKSKITIALLWANYGGEVTSVNDLVLGLNKQRFNVIFIYLSRYGINKNFIEEAGYDVFYLSNIKLIKAFRFSILFRLLRILKEHNVDIIHCHGHKPTFYGSIAAMFTKIPVVIAHVHGLGRSRNFRRRLVNFLSYKKVDKIITVAKSVKDDVLKNNWALSSEKMCVLENSIDFERFANVSVTKVESKRNLGVVPADAFVYGMIARFGPFKGHSFLISAFEKVKKQVASAHLILVGDGLLKEEIQLEVAKAGLDESVHFLGQRDDITKIYKAIDVFVLPSIGSEGMPRVILEAMAAGVPCIGTKVGGTPEIMCNNDIGYVVEPRDSAALAQAMTSVAKMTEKDREKLSEKAQERVRKFYSHIVVRARLAELYEDQYIFAQSTGNRKMSMLSLFC